jgi:hypothetical protein
MFYKTPSRKVTGKVFVPKNTKPIALTNQVIDRALESHDEIERDAANRRIINALSKVDETEKK